MEDSQIETPETMAKLALAVLIAALRTDATRLCPFRDDGPKTRRRHGWRRGAVGPKPHRKAFKVKTEKLKNPHPKKLRSPVSPGSLAA